ncbi:MAG TPA: DUF6519 domain-containing protein [Longimicrobium sp.]|jgi:hypothetical protein
MGNFSRNTFDPRKHYASVRLQQGVPLVDADWNEMDDIRRHEVRHVLRSFVGDAAAVADDGFRIAPLGSSGGINTLVLTAPSAAGGSSVVVDPASTAASVLGFGGGNSEARRTGTGSARLTGSTSQAFALAAGQTLVLRVNGGAPVTVTFQAGAFANIAAATAAEVAAAVNAAGTGLTASTGSGNDVAIGAGTCVVGGWSALNERLLAYSAQPLYQNTALAAAWGVPVLPALTMPGAARTDTVYLDVWEREVGEAEDPTIVNSQIGIETSVRIRREWVVRVAEGQTSAPAPAAGHAHFLLARLARTAQVAIQATQVTDLRAAARTLAAQNVEAARLESAKVDRAGDTVTGNLVVQGRVGVGTGASSPLAPLHLTGGNPNVGTTGVEGDLRIGDATYSLKVGTGLAAAGADAGHTRVRASHRLTLSAGTAAELTLSGTRVEVGSGTATANPLRAITSAATAVQADAVGDTTADKFAVTASATGADGIKYGVQAYATGPAGLKFGVRGNASGDAGTKYGLYGTADGGQDYKYGAFLSASGAAGTKYGLYANASGADGYMYGMYSYASGALGTKYGASFIATGADGPKTGVYVASEGDAGTKLGLHAHAFGVAGDKTGIEVSTSGTDGTKVGVTSSVYGDNGYKYGYRANVSGAAELKIGGEFTVNGTAGNKYGIITYASGRDDTKYGIQAQADGELGAKFGVSAYATGADGSKTGVWGYAGGDQGGKTGVQGIASGLGSNKYGVIGQANGDGGTNYGVYGQAYGAGGAVNWAGYFQGNVHVTGTLSKGAGSFLIDHPLDPENRVLRHNFVESPEYLCLYRGKVTLGKDGAATVAMPEYFKALTDEAGATVQLTPIGARPFLASYEWSRGNDAIIIHGDPGADVSWLVIADRDDPAIKVLRQPVEEAKDGSQFAAGEYLYPDAYPRRKGKRPASPVPEALPPEAEPRRVREDAERVRREAEERVDADEKRVRELRGQQEAEEKRRRDETEAEERRRRDQAEAGADGGDGGGKKRKG